MAYARGGGSRARCDCAGTHRRATARRLSLVCDARQAVVKKRAGPDGAIFGSVTPTEVATVVAELAGVKVEKKHIKVPDLKHVGSGTAELQLHKEVSAKLKIVVVAA